jgi:hypothetical protein
MPDAPLARQLIDFSGSPRSEGGEDRPGHLLGPHLAGAVAPGQVRGTQPIRQRLLDRGLEPVGLLLASEPVAEQHRDREQRGQGIGLAGPGDVRGRAVHRLVHCFALFRFRIDLAQRRRGQHAE